MAEQAAEKIGPPPEVNSGRAALDYRDGYLCVMTESEVGTRVPNEPVAVTRDWYPIKRMKEVEAKALVGRALRRVDSGEGLYVDEEGEAFQLMHKSRTQPIDSKIVPLERPADAETEPLYEVAASSKSQRHPDLMGKVGKGRHSLRDASADRDAVFIGSRREPGATRRRVRRETPSSLAQKLAEVRRRLGYIQKRGHNELFGYTYAMAADIASAVGDALAELGVIVIPHLESISSEPLPAAKERVVRIIMDYALVDSQTGERETIRVPGEGRDPGDKGPYKAMTGALKYALLQTFLIATGDDPENERGEPGDSFRAPEPATIGPEKARQLSELLAETGTEVERVLDYFKVARLEDLSEAAHRKALQILSRKRGRNGRSEASHAQG